MTSSQMLTILSSLLQPLPSIVALRWIQRVSSSSSSSSAEEEEGENFSLYEEFQAHNLLPVVDFPFQEQRKQSEEKKRKLLKPVEEEKQEKMEEEKEQEKQVGEEKVEVEEERAAEEEVEEEERRFCLYCRQLHRQGIIPSLLRSLLAVRYPRIIGTSSSSSAAASSSSPSSSCSSSAPSSIPSLSSAAQLFLYQCLFEDEILQKFPLHHHVSASFVRGLLLLLSSSSSSSFSSSPDVNAFPLPQTISIRVERGLMNNIGLVQWNGGLTLTEFILFQASSSSFSPTSSSPLFNRRSRVLEVGSGVGLSSLALFLTTPVSTVVISDGEEKVLDAVRYNLRINGINETASSSSFPCSSSSSSSSALSSRQVHVLKLNWTQPNYELLSSYNANVIIAAEVTYLPELLQPLASLIANVLRMAKRKQAEQRMRRAETEKAAAKEEVEEEEEEQPFAILCQTERHPLFFVEYLNALREEELKIQEIAIENIPHLFAYERESIFMHKITL